VAWGLDIAFEHSFGNGNLLAVNSLLRRIEDITINRLSFENGSWLQQPVNAGRATIVGVEVELKQRLKDIATSLPDIEVRLNATRASSRIDAIPGPDNRVDRQTPWSGTLTLDYHPTPSLDLGVAFGWKNEGSVRLTELQKQISSGSRNIDVYALWKVNQKTQLRASMTNLLRKTSFQTLTYEDPVERMEQKTTTPTRLAARISLETKF
jgi:outer membrane receptor protein involved in Fe transport